MRKDVLASVMVEIFQERKTQKSKKEREFRQIDPVVPQEAFMSILK